MGFNSLQDFVTGLWEDSFKKMNPHDVLAMLWTGQNADINSNPAHEGDFDKALKSIQALACVMPGTTDLFCTAEDNEYEANPVPNAVFKPVESLWGHFSGRRINQGVLKTFCSNSIVIL